MRGRYLAPFVPSSMPVVREMLNMADVKYGDKLYDLGCGDGRFLFCSLKPPYEAKPIGVELNERRASLLEARLEKYSLDHRIETITGNILEYDVGNADVVTLYLTPRGNKEVKPMLEDQLKNSARVVSHDFSISGWNPSSVHTVVAPMADFGPLAKHTLYLYEMKNI